MNSDLRRFFPELSIDFFLKRQSSYSWKVYVEKLGRSTLSWRSACWTIQVPCIVSLFHQFFFKLFDRDLKDFSPQLSVLIGFLMNPNNTWGKFVCVQFLSNWILPWTKFVHSRRHFSFASSQGSVLLSDTAEVLLCGSPNLVMWSDRCRRRCTGNLV